MSTTTESNDSVKERFRQLMRGSLISSSKTGNPVLDEFREHFGADPAELPFMSDMYVHHLHINRQAAIDAFIARPTCESRLVGVTIPTSEHWGRLSNLLLPPSFPMPGARWGMVHEEQREGGYKTWMRVVTQGLWLFKDENGPGAIWVNGYTLEVMAPTAARAGELIEELRRLSVEHSPYRGQCISVAVIKGVLKPQFMERPTDINKEDVILPPGLLERVEEHVVSIARYSDKLTASKRHLKRGLLLWGRPGTGKTHTIRYLASQLPEHTIMLLPGDRLENLHEMRPLIELCTPGIVVLDDVDYIAEDRTMPSMTQAHNLYELLEALDGVAPDADLLFVLTTNRADTIEPAVAARPGRVDQAAEIPPPDEGCRQRLFALYSKGVSLEMDDEQVAQVIKRTDGVTGSFFKELLRRATLDASNQERRAADGKLIVTNDQVVGALDEMLDPNNPLTPKMLGLETDKHDLVGAEEDASLSA